MNYSNTPYLLFYFFLAAIFAKSNTLGCSTPTASWSLSSSNKSQYQSHESHKKILKNKNLFSIDLEYMLLRSKNESLAYAFENKTLNAPGANSNRIRAGRNIRPKRIWQPGIAISFGWGKDEDSINTTVDWMYYQNTTVDNYTFPPIQTFLSGRPFDFSAGFFPYWTSEYTRTTIPVSDENGFLYMQGRWRLVYNTITWDIGKILYSGGNFSYRPSIGIMTGWIHQRFTINYEQLPTQSGSIESQDITDNNNFWGIGLTASASANWLLGYGLRVHAGLCSSLLTGRTTTRRTANFDRRNNKDFLRAENWSDRIEQIAPSLEMLLGMGWEFKWNNNQYSFSIDCIWKEIYWWNQFDFSSYSKSANTQDNSSRFRGILAAYPTKEKGLNIEGVSLKIQFCF